MEENNKMKNEPVNKLILQMGVPMILSMWIQKDNALINDDGKVIKHIEIPVKSGK